LFFPSVLMLSYFDFAFLAWTALFSDVLRPRLTMQDSVFLLEPDRTRSFFFPWDFSAGETPGAELFKNCSGISCGTFTACCPLSPSFRHLLLSQSPRVGADWNLPLHVDMMISTPTPTSRIIYTSAPLPAGPFSLLAGGTPPFPGSSDH